MPHNKINFIKTFATDFKVGAISASSPSLIKNVLQDVGHGMNCIIEYGPGSGVLTLPLLTRLSPEGKLIAVETNELFAQKLQTVPDARLSVAQGNVVEYMSAYVHEIESGTQTPPDLIVSSIPFTMLSREERSNLIRSTYNALAPGGTFIVFHQYTTIANKLIKQQFGRVETRVELRNVFPCFVIVSKKAVH